MVRDATALTRAAAPTVIAVCICTDTYIYIKTRKENSRKKKSAKKTTDPVHTNDKLTTRRQADRLNTVVASPATRAVADLGRNAHRAVQTTIATLWTCARYSSPAEWARAIIGASAVPINAALRTNGGGACCTVPANRARAVHNMRNMIIFI